MKWSEMKTETKISLLALLSSIAIFSWTTYENNQSKLLEETRAVTKLNIMELMSNHPQGRLSQQDLFQSYIKKYGEEATKKEISQALYELVKDKIAIFTYSSNTYELLSFDSLHDSRPALNKSSDSNTTSVVDS